MSNRIKKAIDSLLIKTKGEIFSRIEQVSFDVNISDTQSKCYCYSVKRDNNGNLRVQDLIDFVDEKIVDYAIPKKKIDEAKQYLSDTGSTSKIVKLKKQAVELFTSLKKTGEGGELLLYILAIEILKIPQLISKMSLKTSGELHYQGSDGIHVKYNQTTKSLDLFWGESKMYKKASDAFSECFKSLNSYLLDPYSFKSTQERDLVLITDNISQNINNENFEDLFVAYFDKDNDLSNYLTYKGICFIGYDSDKYGDSSKTIDKIKEELSVELEKHYKNISKQIKKYSGLDKKEIHVFLMPFPSVEDFRKYYLNTLKV